MNQRNNLNIWMTADSQYLRNYELEHSQQQNLHFGFEDSFPSPPLESLTFHFMDEPKATNDILIQQHHPLSTCPVLPGIEEEGQWEFKREFQDSEFEQQIADKSNKGLKHYSKFIMELLKWKGKATQQEILDWVENHLAENTRKNKAIPISGTQELKKSDKNIKRRLYDVLNVLSATGLLLKSSRKKQYRINPENPFLNKQSDENIRLLTKASKAEEKIKKKSQNIDALNKKLTRLQTFLQRNKNLEVPSDQRVMFPIIAANQSNRSDIKVDYSDKKIRLKSNQPVDVYGDLDLLEILEEEQTHSKAD